jgi:hypothetical protein
MDAETKPVLLAAGAAELLMRILATRLIGDLYATALGLAPG